MSDWSPPAADFDDVKMGEGLDASMRVSDATQAARDRQSGWLRATYESSGDPTGLGTVEPRIQKAAGGKAKTKSTWQPPAEDFAAPDVFTESKQQPEPKSVSLIDQLIQPWKGESLGSLYEQNAYVRWHDYNQKVNSIAAEIRGKNPDIGPLELATQATDAYRQKYGKPAEMDINWAELPHRLYQQITEQPAAFISQMAKGMVTDPQMFLATASGNALVKAAKIGSQFGVQAAGIAGAKELQEQGAMSPQAVMQEGVSGSLMGGVLSLAHSALSVGLQSAKPGKVTPEVERAAAERFDESVAEGLSPDLAMTRVMRENGMEADKAEAVGAAISPVNRALDDVLKLMKGPEDASSERIGPESNLDEHPPGDQGGTPAEAGGSDRIQRGGQEPQAQGVEPGAVRRGQFGNSEVQHADLTTDKGSSFSLERRAPGQYNIISDSGENIGCASYVRFASGDWKMTGIIVKPKFQRQGIASATYDFLEKQIGEPFKYTGSLSSDGHAFWADRSARLTVRESVPPKVSDELRRLQDYERRVQTDVEDLTGEAKYQALRDTSTKIAELQGGKADPKLLAMLALPGVGAAAGYWLGQDQGQKIRDAIIGGGLGAGAIVLGRVMGASSRLLDGLKDTRYRIGHLTDDHAKGLALGEWGSYRVEQALNAMLPKIAEREAALHAYQAGTRDGMSPMQNKYIDALERGFAKVGEVGQAAGVLPEELLKNYVTQLWVKGLNTKESLIENLKRALAATTGTSPGMSPNSRFAKQRSIPNYKAGIEAGLVPTTLDPSAILRIYTNNINRAIQNRKLIDALGRERNQVSEPIIASGEKLEELARQRVRAAYGDTIDPIASKMVADISAIKAPQDYVFINHPQMRNVKVHPDVAAPMKALFDAGDANAATRAAYALSIAAKRGIFSFSLFHAKSLLDAMLGTSPSGWKHVPGALKMLREGDNPALRDLIGAGLRVIDKPLEADASAFSNALRVLEAKAPMAAMPIKGVRWMQQHMDQFLWGVVHPSFKVAAALAAYEKQLLKNPKIPREQVAKNVVSYTNDIFGGLDWFKIADGVQNRYGRDLALALTSPSGRRFMQIAMLAPDWTVATTRAMAKAIPGVSSKEIASMHRGYVLRSALVYLTVAEGLNQTFSGHHLWENKDPTMVDLGDGRRMQLSKHFMEPVHWLTKPSQQLMNKLGYVVAEPMKQALNQEYLSTKGAPPIENRATHALKGMLPIPSTVAAQQGAGPAISGFLGAPIYGKTEEQAVNAAIERALNLRAKRLESDDPAEQRKAKSESQTKASAERRVHKQYDKQRAEQRKREQ